MTPPPKEYPSGTGGSGLMSEADEMPINTLKSRQPSVSKNGNDCHLLEKNCISELLMDLWYHVTAINITMNTSHVQRGVIADKASSVVPRVKSAGKAGKYSVHHLIPTSELLSNNKSFCTKQNPQ
jgi:hypothetical protein